MKNPGVSNENANYFIETVYDTIMEMVRAKMFIEGFKAAGLNAHEAEVSYMGRMGFSEADVRFANELRYFRNGIVYYGKHMKSDYANKAIEFLESVYPKLKEILGIIHDDVDEGKNKP